MDTGTRPPAMGRVEPSGPIQAEQVPFTVMDTGTQAEHLKTLESKIVDAVKHLKDVEGKCKDVENSFNEKQEELKAVEAKGKEAENLLERKQDELRTVEAKSRDVEYRLERKQEELRTVEAKSRDVEYRLERKQEELKTVEGKYKDEENRLKEKQEERKTVEAKGRDVEYRLEKKQEELRDVEGKYKDEENRFKKKQEELKAVEAQCKDVENRFKKKQEDLKDVQRKCKDEENRFKEKQEALNKSRHIHNCGKKSKYTKKTKRNTRALATMPLKVDTAGVTTKLNEQEQNSLLERITSFAKAGLEYFPLTKDKNLKKFCTYLTDSIQIHLTGKQAGSLILSVHCRTLEILEQLWQDYSSGHLDSVVKECFLTDETTIGLETTISEKEYLRCKEFLTDISGLESLTDDESVAMENIKYKNILLKFYVLLLEKLDPNEVSVQLLTAGVLTSGDKEKVEEKPSQREKSEELLMILATKGPRGYEEFVKALEKNHCFLACQLLKEEKENLLYEVREREWLLNETMSDLLLEEERAITAASENEMLKTQLEKEKNPASQKKAVTLVEIARMMEDLESSWRQLVTALELGEANLCKIRKENKTDREKAYAVLTMWTDKEGEDATVERLIDTLEKIAKSRPVEKMPGSEEIRDEEVEVNRLLKKTKDEISVENRKKEATRESSAEAALKELGIQLPEEEDEDEQKEVAKLLKEVNDEISVENRKKEGRKDTSLEAASVKELTNQPQEASSQEGKKPKRKVYKKKAMAS